MTFRGGDVGGWAWLGWVDRDGRRCYGCCEAMRAPHHAGVQGPLPMLQLEAPPSGTPSSADAREAVASQEATPSPSLRTIHNITLIIASIFV